MSIKLTRRDLIAKAAATAVIGALGEPLWGTQLNFGTVLGALGVGLFPGAAAALGGFELIQLISNTNTLVQNLNDAAQNANNLLLHMDTVLTQISSTLNTVQNFVQDCDNALHDIESLLGQLPSTLSTAFDASAAKQAFARLNGRCATMNGYLVSSDSIIAQASVIQHLTEQMVVDISSLDASVANDIQFVMQVVPGVSTWVQGYTAYNLVLKPNSRGANPWDHQLVSGIALPRIKKTIQSIGLQRTGEGSYGSKLPLDSGALYTFDSSSFSKTDKAFATKYPNGQIDGLYYTIWPAGAQPESAPAPPGAPPGFTPPGIPQSGDLCFLMLPVAGYRYWLVAPTVQAPGPFVGPDLAQAHVAAMTFPRLMAADLKITLAFDQLTDGWQLFDNAVKEKLINVDKTAWNKMPQLIGHA